MYHWQERFPPGSALHGDHLSLAVRIVLAHVRYARGLRWWLVVSARVVMAVTRRDDAGPMRCLRAVGERISHQMIILPRPCPHGIPKLTGQSRP